MTSSWRMTPDWRLTTLNKEPGIYSARYLGEDTPYSVKNANLIQRLEGVPEEQADSQIRVCHCRCITGRKRTDDPRCD